MDLIDRIDIPLHFLTIGVKRQFNDGNKLKTTKKKKKKDSILLT